MWESHHEKTVFVILLLLSNIYIISAEGTPSPDLYGTYISASDIRSNISGELALRVKFSADTPINFSIEVTQAFNKPAYNRIVSRTNGCLYTRTVKRNKFDFSSLFLKIGLFFKI